MKLNQLRYYREVCRLGSISKAAESLHISQPSVSVAVQELEEEYGLTLLNRQGRGFTVTQDGLDFLEGADALLNHAERFEKQMLSLHKKRRLRLGSPPMIGFTYLPRICEAAENAPLPMEIELSEAGRHTMQTRLLENQIDMAFLPHHALLPPQLDSIPVTVYDIVFCVEPGNPLAERSAITMDMLRDIPLVMFKNDFFLTQVMLDRFRETGITPNILLQTEQVSTVHKMITSRLACGFMFRNMAESFSDLVAIPLEPPSSVLVSLAWKSGTGITPEMRWLMEYIRTLNGSGKDSTAP